MTPRHRLEALLELSRRLSSSLDLDRVVADFARSAAELLGATSCAISVLDADGATLTTLWDHEQRPDRAASRPGALFADLAAFPATRRVLDEQRPLVISADRDEDDDAERRDMAALRLRTRLMVPLVARGETVGLLEVGHADRDGFESEDIEFCQALADLFAPALQNATLHRRLVEAEAHLRSHVDQIPAVTYVDEVPSGRTTYVSPQLTGLFGCTPEQWIADPDYWLTLVHPEDRERAAASFREACENGSSFCVEYRVQTPDGRTVWVRDQAVPIEGADGIVSAIQGVIFDITELKLAEQQLAFLAYHDPLTGLPNRAWFAEQLTLALARRAATAAAAPCCSSTSTTSSWSTTASATPPATSSCARWPAASAPAAATPTWSPARAATSSWCCSDRSPGRRRRAVEQRRAPRRPRRTRIRQACGCRSARRRRGLRVSAASASASSRRRTERRRACCKHADTAMYAPRRTAADATAPPARRTSADRSLAVVGRLRRAVDTRASAALLPADRRPHDGAMIGAEALMRWFDPSAAWCSRPIHPARRAHRPDRRRSRDWVVEQACRQAAGWRALGLDLYVSSQPAAAPCGSRTRCATCWSARSRRSGSIPAG